MCRVGTCGGAISSSPARCDRFYIFSSIILTFSQFVSLSLQVDMEGLVPDHANI